MAQTFHQHLDECERCRTRPFDLCAVGHRLLQASVADGIDLVRERLGVDRRLGAVEHDEPEIPVAGVGEHADGYGHEI